MSEHDLNAGDRWAVEIGKRLEDTHFGIIVLTAENQAAPWVLFEAGALSKSLTAGSVCPFLVDLDLREVTGPLSQFQAKKSDRASVLELIKSINSRTSAANGKPEELSVLQERFDAMWPKLEEVLSKLPKAATSAAGSARKRSTEQVLEDVVETNRRLETALEEVTRALRRGGVARTGFPVLLTIDGDFPGIDRDVKQLTFSAGSDVVEDVASIAALDLSKFGKDWHLLEGPRGANTVTRADGPRLATLSRNQRVVLNLSEIPF